MRSFDTTSLRSVSVTVASDTSARMISSMRLRRARASPVCVRASTSWLLSSATCCSLISRPPVSTMLCLALNSSTARSAIEVCPRSSLMRSCSHTLARRVALYLASSWSTT